MPKAALVLPLLALGCSSPRTVSIEGLWLSQGYGLFLEVGNGQILTKEITARSCISSEDTLVRVAVEPNGAWRLTVGDNPPSVRFQLDSESVARMERAGTASDILFQRTNAPAPICAQPVTDTPQNTFDVFWTTFREHYPFFEMKGIDWNSVRESLQPRINDATTPDELFAILAEAIAPLEDVHTSITAESVGRASFMRPDPELGGTTAVSDAIPTMEQRFTRALEIIQRRYVEGELRSFCNGHLRYGELSGGIGYIYLDQEGDYTKEPGFAATLEVFETALDTVFTTLDSANGVILDVRKNYGGSDILSLAVASRLATTEYIAYAKVARSDPEEPTRYTPRQERIVPTTNRPGFTGPVAQLIGRYTISAGETLTQALLGREPHITRIGENTQGVFSDVMGRTLPNGWQVGLPNELFLTEDGTNFDGQGIPPDIEVPVFRSADLDAGRDPALKRAIDFLASAGR